MKLYTLITILFLTVTVTAQKESITNFSLKKGEVLDVLLLSQKKNTNDYLRKYFKEVIPVGEKNSYQSLGSYALKKHTLGNLNPSIVVLGKWATAKSRRKFARQIEDEVPDFHQQRRNIWSLFNVTYYEMPRAINFSINKNKINVLTSFWSNGKAGLKTVKEELFKILNKHNGIVVLGLKDGKSPFGYHYQPDYFVITEFENEEAFQKFYNGVRKINTKQLQQIHQFIIK